MADFFTVTVSQVNRYVSTMIAKEEKLSDLYIKGEISNFTDHYKTGHLYFTLKDSTSQLKAVMFNGYTKGLKFKPENGMSVLVRGAIKVYEAGGQYQLYATEIMPSGIGELYLAFEQLKTKLSAEGLFEQKRELPQRPEHICIITAEGSAALQDMLNILSRRWPMVKVTLIPVTVQGQTAPKSLVKALQAAQSTNADVIIFGRGGGSVEDLWAFNDEQVARAVFASKIPTISAVGHETDFVITDFVADLRAPTPSAAAELAVPDIEAVYGDLVSLAAGMENHISTKINRHDYALTSLEKMISSISPVGKLALAEKRLSEMTRQCQNAIQNTMLSAEKRINSAVDVVSALNPLNVLDRGYSIVSKGKSIVKDAEQLTIGDDVTITFHQGKAKATIIAVETEKKDR